MRVVLHAPDAPMRAVASILSRDRELDVLECRTPAIAAQALGGSEILILQQSLYCGEVEEAASSSPALRWIQLLSAGYEKLDGRRFPPGVRITNAGPSFAYSVADHALALLLCLTRRMPAAISNQGLGKWDPSAPADAISLHGRRGLVVGFGPIGQAIAARLRAFGMSVSAVNRSGRDDVLVDRMYPLQQLDRALAESEIVAIALPQTAETAGLFDRERIGHCMEGAYLLNVGRGALVDLDAVLAALERGHLAGAGLDVTDPEPLPDDHPAWATPNLLITPHVGGRGAYADLAAFVEANLQAYRAGRPLAAEVSLRRG